MAHEKQTVSKETGNGATPFLIIGLILLATIVGIWWISQTGNPDLSNQNVANTANSTARQNTNKYATAPPGAVPDNFKGSRSATVVVEEFADFQCGACAEKHSVFNEISSHYGSRIRYVFRNYPLVRAHPKAYDAAVAAEAAGLQGKFWDMQNLLFQNHRTWSNDPNHRNLFEGYAKTIGSNVEKYTNDFLGIVAKNRVNSDMQRGNALGVVSTPTVYINGKSIRFEQMTIAGLKLVIDAELKRIEEASKKQTKSEDMPSNKKDDETSKKEDSNSNDKSENSENE